MFSRPTHAIRAVRDVVNLGAGLSAIWGDLTYVIVSTVILFILGVVLFRRSMSS
jgi:hypothetical protein